MDHHHAPATTGVPRLPLARLADARRFASLSLGYLATSLIPTRSEVQLTRWIYGVVRRFYSHRTAALAAEISDLLGSRLNGRNSEDIAAEHLQMRIENNLGRVGGMHHGGWRPQVEVEGLGPVREALTAGRGVILWRMEFTSSLAVIWALCEAGVPLVHLTREEHGASEPLTWFGVRCNAVMYRRPELWFYRDRVVIPLDGSMDVMQELVNLVNQNHVISFMGEHPGKRPLVVQFFERPADFAGGAPGLAWRTGAALFTVSAQRLGPCQYRVLIHPAIEMDRQLDKSVAVKGAVQQFADRLAEQVTAHPADWTGWKTGRL